MSQLEEWQLIRIHARRQTSAVIQALGKLVLLHIMSTVISKFKFSL